MFSWPITIKVTECNLHVVVWIESVPKMIRFFSGYPKVLHKCKYFTNCDERITQLFNMNFSYLRRMHFETIEGSYVLMSISLFSSSREWSEQKACRIRMQCNEIMPILLQWKQKKSFHLLSSFGTTYCKVSLKSAICISSCHNLHYKGCVRYMQVSHMYQRI